MRKPIWKPHISTPYFFLYTTRHQKGNFMLISDNKRYFWSLVAILFGIRISNTDDSEC